MSIQHRISQTMECVPVCNSGKLLKEMQEEGMGKQKKIKGGKENEAKITNHHAKTLRLEWLGCDFCDMKCYFYCL